MPALTFTAAAAAHLAALRESKGLAKRARAVLAALGKLERDPRHPGLNTHKMKGVACPHKGELFEAYAENHTPGAYRIFFCYEPAPVKDTILIVAITPHP